MIYDCFTFFNELDLLEIRLNTLNDVVDKFVIAEATRTFTGRPKPLYYQENRARFAAFKDKIIHIVVDDLIPEEEVAKDTFNLPWVNENRQRNAIAKGLAKAKDEDVILLSDLDEIPRPERIAEAVALAKAGEIVRFKLKMFTYFVNYHSFRDPWWLLGTQAISVGTFRRAPQFDAFVCDRYTQASENDGHTLMKVRMMGSTKILSDAGWHFGYLGGIKAIKAKFNAFSHFDEVQKILPKIEERLAAGVNLFGGRRDLFALPVDETLPKYLLDNRERFKHLFFEVTPEYLQRTAFAHKFATLRGITYRFCVRLVPRFLVGPLSKVWRWVNFR